MRTLVVLALAWCCSGQLVPYHPWAVKFQASDQFGRLSFGHESLYQTRHEIRLPDGRVIGQFSYVDPNGEPAITYFEAGPGGYRVLGSNVLPEAPVADLALPVNDLVAPEAVGYTPEVAAARADFMKIFEGAAEAAEPDVAPEVKSAPAATFAEDPAPSADNLVAPEPVKYTPEVAEARAEFMKVYEETAAAAEAAPDDVPEVKAAPAATLSEDIAPSANELAAPEPVDYTPEVAAARAEFFKTYEETAAAAAAAPGTPEVASPPAATLAAATFSAGETAAKEETVAETPAAEEPVPEVEVSRKKRQVMYNFNTPHFIGHTLYHQSSPVKADDDTKPLYYSYPLSSYPSLYSGLPFTWAIPSSTSSGSRQRRDLSVPLPYLHAVPTETETTVETKHFETVDAATPADTTKLQLTTQEHVIKVPGIKYVQPVVDIKPVKYTIASPAVVPFRTPFPYYPYAFHGLQYPTALAPSPKKEE